MSNWAKKYAVIEIPPYWKQRGGKEDRELNVRTEGNEEDAFGESWSLMVSSGDRDNAEAMDCSSSLDRQGGSDIAPM